MAKRNNPNRRRIGENGNFIWPDSAATPYTHEPVTGSFPKRKFTIKDAIHKIKVSLYNLPSIPGSDYNPVKSGKLSSADRYYNHLVGLKQNLIDKTIAGNILNNIDPNTGDLVETTIKRPLPDFIPDPSNIVLPPKGNVTGSAVESLIKNYQDSSDMYITEEIIGNKKRKFVNISNKSYLPQTLLSKNKPKYDATYSNFISNYQTEMGNIKDKHSIGISQLEYANLALNNPDITQEFMIADIGAEGFRKEFDKKIYRQYFKPDVTGDLINAELVVNKMDVAKRQIEKSEGIINSAIDILDTLKENNKSIRDFNFNEAISAATDKSNVVLNAYQNIKTRGSEVIVGEIDRSILSEYDDIVQAADDSLPNSAKMNKSIHKAQLNKKISEIWKSKREAKIEELVTSKSDRIALLSSDDIVSMKSTNIPESLLDKKNLTKEINKKFELSVKRSSKDLYLDPINIKRMIGENNLRDIAKIDNVVNLGPANDAQRFVTLIQKQSNIYNDITKGHISSAFLQKDYSMARHSDFFAHLATPAEDVGVGISLEGKYKNSLYDYNKLIGLEKSSLIKINTFISKEKAKLIDEVNSVFGVQDKPEALVKPHWKLGKEEGKHYRIEHSKVPENMQPDTLGKLDDELRNQETTGKYTDPNMPGRKSPTITAIGISDTFSSNASLHNTGDKISKVTEPKKVIDRLNAAINKGQSVSAEDRALLTALEVSEKYPTYNTEKSTVIHLSNRKDLRGSGKILSKNKETNRLELKKEESLLDYSSLFKESKNTGDKLRSESFGEFNVNKISGNNASITISTRTTAGVQASIETTIQDIITASTVVNKGKPLTQGQISRHIEGIRQQVLLANPQAIPIYKDIPITEPIKDIKQIPEKMLVAMQSHDSLESMATSIMYVTEGKVNESSPNYPTKVKAISDKIIKILYNQAGYAVSMDPAEAMSTADEALMKVITDVQDTSIDIGKSVMGKGEKGADIIYQSLGNFIPTFIKEKFSREQSKGVFHKNYMYEQILDLYESKGLNKTGTSPEVFLKNSIDIINANMPDEQFKKYSPSQEEITKYVQDRTSKFNNIDENTLSYEAMAEQEEKFMDFMDEKSRSSEPGRRERLEYKNAAKEFGSDWFDADTPTVNNKALSELYDDKITVQRMIKGHLKQSGMIHAVENIRANSSVGHIYNNVINVIKSNNGSTQKHVENLLRDTIGEYNAFTQGTAAAGEDINAVMALFNKHYSAYINSPKSHAKTMVAIGDILKSKGRPLGTDTEGLLSIFNNMHWFGKKAAKLIAEDIKTNPDVSKRIVSREFNTFESESSLASYVRGFKKNETIIRWNDRDVIAKWDSNLGKVKLLEPNGRKIITVISDKELKYNISTKSKKQRYVSTLTKEISTPQTKIEIHPGYNARAANAFRTVNGSTQMLPSSVHGSIQNLRSILGKNKPFTIYDTETTTLPSVMGKKYFSLTEITAKDAAIDKNWKVSYTGKEKQIYVRQGETVKKFVNDVIRDIEVADNISSNGRKIIGKKVHVRKMFNSQEPIGILRNLAKYSPGLQGDAASYDAVVDFKQNILPKDMPNLVRWAKEGIKELNSLDKKGISELEAIEALNKHVGNKVLLSQSLQDTVFIKTSLERMLTETDDPAIIKRINKALKTTHKTIDLMHLTYMVHPELIGPKIDPITKKPTEFGRDVDTLKKFFNMKQDYTHQSSVDVDINATFLQKDLDKIKNLIASGTSEGKEMANILSNKGGKYSIKKGSYVAKIAGPTEGKYITSGVYKILDMQKKGKRQIVSFGTPSGELIETISFRNTNELQQKIQHGYVKIKAKEVSTYSSHIQNDLVRRTIEKGIGGDYTSFVSMRENALYGAGGARRQQIIDEFGNTKKIYEGAVSKIEDSIKNNTISTADNISTIPKGKLRLGVDRATVDTRTELSDKSMSTLRSYKETPMDIDLSSVKTATRDIEAIGLNKVKDILEVSNISKIRKISKRQTIINRRMNIAATRAMDLKRQLVHAITTNQSTATKNNIQRKHVKAVRELNEIKASAAKIARNRGVAQKLHNSMNTSKDVATILVKYRKILLKRQADKKIKQVVTMKVGRVNKILKEMKYSTATTGPKAINESASVRNAYSKMSQKEIDILTNNVAGETHLSDFLTNKEERLADTYGDKKLSAEQKVRAEKVAGYLESKEGIMVANEKRRAAVINGIRQYSYTEKEYTHVTRAMNDAIMNSHEKYSVPWIKTIGEMNIPDSYSPYRMNIDVSSVDAAKASISSILSQKIDNEGTRLTIQDLNSRVSSMYGIDTTGIRNEAQLATKLYHEGKALSLAEFASNKPLSDPKKIRKLKKTLRKIIEEPIIKRTEGLPLAKGVPLYKEIFKHATKEVRRIKDIVSPYVKIKSSLPNEVINKYTTDFITGRNMDATTLSNLGVKAKAIKRYSLKDAEKLANEQFDTWFNKNSKDIHLDKYQKDELRKAYMKEFKGTTVDELAKMNREGTERVRDYTLKSGVKESSIPIALLSPGETPLDTDYIVSRQMSNEAWRDIVNVATSENYEGSKLKQQALDMLNWEDTKEVSKYSIPTSDLAPHIDRMSNQMMTEGDYAGFAFKNIPEEELGEYRERPFSTYIDDSLTKDKQLLSREIAGGSREGQQLRRRVTEYLDALTRVGQPHQYTDIGTPYSPLPDFVETGIKNAMDKAIADASIQSSGRGPINIPPFTGVVQGAGVSTNQTVVKAGNVISNGVAKGKTGALMGVIGIGVALGLAGMIIGGNKYEGSKDNNEENVMYGSGSNDIIKGEKPGVSFDKTSYQDKGVHIKVSGRAKGNIPHSDYASAASRAVSGSIKSNINVTTRDDSSKISRQWVEDQFLRTLKER